MNLYVIQRRYAWDTPEELEAAAARSTAEGRRPGAGVRWIRSYVVREDSGQLGTVCLYEAESPEHIRAHAKAADMATQAITPVMDTVVVNADPARA